MKSMLISLMGLLILAPTASAQNAPRLGEDSLSSMAGHVMDRAGKPLPGTLVIAMHLPDNQEAGRATTDPQGAYEFHLESGDYAVTAEKSGYVKRAYTRRESAASVRGTIRLRAGENRRGLDFWLDVGASVAGTATDERNQPLAGAWVQLYRTLSEGRRRFAVPAGGVDTDAEGRFRFDSLSADSYYLSVRARPETKGQLITYYPAALDLDTASSIPVYEGAQIANLSVRMRSGVAYAVRGTVKGGAGMYVELTSRAARVFSAAPVGGTVKGEEGTFEIGNVAPGEYRIYVYDREQRRYAVKDLSVIDGDVENVELEARATPPLRGRLLAPPGKTLNLQGTVVEISPVDRLPRRRMAGWVAADGTFSIPRVVPGPYEAYPTQLPDWAFAEAMVFDGHALADGAFEAPAEGRGELEIHLAADGGAIAGVVRDATGRPAVGVWVLTIPDGHGAENEVYMSVTDDSGHFAEKSLRPGTYVVYSWANNNPRRLSREGASPYERMGKRVTVRSGEMAQVQLTTIGE